MGKRMFMDMSFYDLQELANPTVEAPGKGYIGEYSTVHLLFSTFIYIINLVSVAEEDLQDDNNHVSFGQSQLQHIL